MCTILRSREATAQYPSLHELLRQPQIKAAVTTGLIPILVAYPIYVRGRGVAPSVGVFRTGAQRLHKQINNVDLFT
jgi:hypothetical protein